MMRERLNLIRKFWRREQGQALVIVLVLMTIGGLTLPPVLSHIGTALKTGHIYSDRTDELYAADSGIEDAIWQIKFDRLSAICENPDYDTYDYDTTWEYTLGEEINGWSVNVTIQNVWIPMGVTAPDAADAREIAEANKLMVAGTSPTPTEYEIKLTFTPGEGEEDLLMVESLGVWLPHGFTYVEDSSNLEDDPGDDYYSVPDVTPYAGGYAVVWDFSSVPFTSFPGVNPTDVPMIATIDFVFDPDVPGTIPVGIAWMETAGVDDVPLSWDIDTRIFKITSTAGNTQIDAYGSRCELRNMESAIAGDYRAIGNSLMQDNYSPYDRRDTLLSESTTTLDSIPNDPNDDAGDVIAAYLYWSGWFSSGFATPISPWPDTCDNFNNWTNTVPNTVWQISSNQFAGHYVGTDANARYLTMASSMNLSSYDPGAVVVEWDQSEGGTLEGTDGLQFQFSGDGGSNWSNLYTALMDDTSASYFYYIIPEEYLTAQFKMRFYLADMSGSGEYAYIDNFAVAEITGTGDTTCTFKIDGTQVYLDGDNQPQQGAQEITATRTQVIGNKNRGEYSYASFRDVTKLVKEYAEIIDDDYHTGNADYTVGSVDADTGGYWSYAGWSLIVVYSSPATAGHQLYLFDTFAFSGGNENLDFDHDGSPGGDISGFVVPEPIEGEDNAGVVTVFIGEGDNAYSGDYFQFNGTSLSDGYSTSNVWNSQSIGMSEPGVEIDTFYVTWASGLLVADDTEAHIDLPTGTDNWNLIYIILSLRSETVTGGTTHYVIHSGT
ncbi:MAG: hypothetical protein ABID87_06995 [Chloroflexota bacterium]